MDLDAAEDVGYITHASNLKLKSEEKDDYDKGLLFDPVPEILTKGHLAKCGHKIKQERVDRLQE